MKDLKSKDKLLIEFDYDAFNSTYFNKLVEDLPNHNVSEIRPRQKISITHGINNNTLNKYLEELVIQIKSYNKVRTQVFGQFLLSLGLDKIEVEFYKLREKLQSLNAWPKGNFENWHYWSHGIDIEFDNYENGSHFNIAMSNINSIKYWSIHRYIESIVNKSQESKFIVKHKQTIPKMFDLLVLQNRLVAIRTPFGEKQYEVEK